VDAKAVCATCLDHGLVVNAVTPSAIRMAPPLTVTETELAEAIHILAGAIVEVQEMTT